VFGGGTFSGTINGAQQPLTKDLPLPLLQNQQSQSPQPVPRSIKKPIENKLSADDSTLTREPSNAPPLPPRPADTLEARQKTLESSTKPGLAKPPPPLPPREPTPTAIKNKDRPSSQIFTQRTSANCFSKIFNECPLTVFAATSWTHPDTKNHHLIFASDEGIYSLNLDDLQNIEMFQIFARPCRWVYVIRNILISICGSPNNDAPSHVYMHNLVSLHGQNNIELFIPVPKGVAYTTKVPGTSNAQKCCVVHNPYNNQMYLYVGRKNAVLLLQWYEPLQKFMIARDFECKLPPTLTLFEPLVVKDSEYPILCVGAYQTASGEIIFDQLDLEGNTEWTPRRDCLPLNIKTFSQLQKDVIMLAYDKKVTFVDIAGKRLHVRNRLTDLTFDYPVHSAVCLPGSVLTFNQHGIQGKSLVDNQVTAQFHDTSRDYKLLGSDRIVVIESRVHSENHSNLYILASS